MAPGGRGQGETDRADRGDQSDLRRAEAAVREDDRDERIQDAESRAKSQGEQAQGDHRLMVASVGIRQ